MLKSVTTGVTCNLTWREAAESLAKSGVPVPASRAVRDVDDVVRAAEEVGFPPVAIKIDDAEILHKADVGGVFIGVKDSDGAAPQVPARIHSRGGRDHLCPSDGSREDRSPGGTASRSRVRSSPGHRRGRRDDGGA